MPRWKKSSKRSNALTQSATSNAPPSRIKTGSSNARPKALELCVDSNMVIAKPTATADAKKKNGNAGVYQNGCNLLGMIRYRLPSELWCSVESKIPATISTGYIALIHLIGAFRSKRSKTLGRNSKKSTVVYVITHMPTSNITECGFM